MNLNTIYSLNYGDDGGIIEQGETIKIHLENGEILIGGYESSDNTFLFIDRGVDLICIDFEEIKDIEKID